MKSRTSCRALLISSEHREFKKKETGETIQFYDVKFAIESEAGGIEIITFRPREFTHPAPTFKDLEGNRLPYGDLTYEWRFSAFSNGFKPFFVEFRA